MSGMQAFVEAVKQRSLGAAAEHLGISRTLVSRQIQTLEDELGVRLMNRTTRSLSLTEAGQRYFHFCDEILTRVNEMDRQVSSEAAEARGEISVLGPKWLHTPATALLTAFAKRHPDIRPRLILGGIAQTAYGFLEQGCDIALHTRPIPDSRILARKISDIPYCLCASPDYLESASPLNHPADIANHHALVHFNYHTWQFEQNGKEERYQPVPGFSANTFFALRDAALGGLGLALLPVPLVREVLANGQLKAALPAWTPSGQTLYVAIAPGTGVPVRVKLLMDFVVEWFARNEL
ncbi:LysR family transcriptional regulator [Paraburkholderia sp. SG-MS1]|uniref:LysR family transcriptional regulator n=1 Tax=Paraburkholderia sp. SG-MS1 TaxID=2023741 RepID=UPI001EEB0F50|nr:LysR family transcriptional regulator [Paraburkholderia sp. SG-MS1]